MRVILHLIAAIIFLVAILWWCHAGFNQGWTKTNVQVMKFDEITEISYPENVERFVPGVDFLVAAAALYGLMVGGIILYRKKAKS
jgi:hypothetical protein